MNSKKLKKDIEKLYSNSLNIEEPIFINYLDSIKSIEKVRFVNSGTEATMSAVRLARGYTKKDLVIKFEGCYHGHADIFLSLSLIHI